MLDLFPDTAAVENGELTLGGLSAETLAEQFGTPLYVYCEATLRTQARALRSAADGALLVYGAKAFPNVALMRLLAEEGIGADVSSLGELALARAAGIEGPQLVMHGNNKSDEELAAAAAAGALVVLDALDEPERAAAAGVKRVLVRVNPDVDADTHVAIRTGHYGAKFGLAAADALTAVAAARAAGLEVLGLHVHVGSQLDDARAHLAAVEQIAELALRCREAIDWIPALVDIGGGFGIRHVESEPDPPVPELIRAVAGAVSRAWVMRGLAPPALALEPGRSLVGRAGVTLYRIGAVKRQRDRVFASIDGGMSDNPRPQLYGALYTALSAGRAAQDADEEVTIAGKHCESGDVLIERVALPAPRRGDLLAIPATGAYTLAMSSNYNGVPRPAAVLVVDGEAREIRRRETVEDLLAREV